MNIYKKNNLVNFVDTDSFVIAGANKFFSSWRIVDVDNS